jgi:hypothetical protein
MKRREIVLVSLGIVAVFIVWLGGLWVAGVYGADPNQKVPDAMALRLRNVQVDLLQTNGSLIQLQAQYNQLAGPLQSTIQHDNHELDLLKAEALATAQLDPDKFDVNLEKMEFVAKPPAPAPAEKKDKK